MTEVSKPIKRCKKCKVIYVDDPLFHGKCPKCGSKQ